MKFLGWCIILMGLIATACSNFGPVRITEIEILPPGGMVDSITAYVEVKGSGTIRADWTRYAYGEDSIVKFQYWRVDSAATYTLTIPVTNGWYHFTAYDTDSVLLAASDSFFCGEGSQQPPLAYFVGNPTSGEATLSVAFSDESFNEPESWRWDFGDNKSYLWGTDTLPYPNIRYDSVGKKTVTLIVTNVSGKDTCVREDYIEVSPPPPLKADFIAEPTSGQAPLEVTFIDQTTPSRESFWSWEYQWYFGDGDSTIKVGGCEHQYFTTGTYTVKLKVIRHDLNPPQIDSLIREDYIVVE